MSACKNCLKILVCKYNDGHNLYCKDDYECPHFSSNEKQTPKKPLNPCGRYGGSAKGGNCPICGSHTNSSTSNYCRKCGQALDWGETE